MRSIWFSILFLLIPAYGLAQPSLDEITARIRRELVTIRSPERPLRQGQIFDPYYYFFGQALPPGKGSYPLGSGFVLPDGKHVVSSFRQIEGSSRLEIVSAQGQVYETQLLAADAGLDLVVLRIKGGKGFSGLDFADSKASRLGDSLWLFGRSVRLLMVRANISSLESSEGHFGRHWLIDTPTHPGVSGGPAVDARGRVVGMAAFNPQGPSQLGVVLPAALIVRFSQQLIRNGKISRSWIGVLPKNLASLDDFDAITGKEIKGGVLVENLIVDGPAAKAGIQIGDFILAINGTTVLQTSDLHDFLDRHKVGEPVALKIHRRNQGRLEIRLQLGELPSAQDLPNASQLL